VGKESFIKAGGQGGKGITEKGLGERIGPKVDRVAVLYDVELEKGECGARKKQIFLLSFARKEDRKGEEYGRRAPESLVSPRFKEGTSAKTTDHLRYMAGSGSERGMIPCSKAAAATKENGQERGKRHN